MANEDNYVVNIENVTFNVRHVTPFPHKALEHEKMFNEGKLAPYDIRRNIIKTFAISRNDQMFIKEDVFNGVVPDSVTVCFVASNAYHGDLKQNPYNFQNFGLDFLAFYVNGQSLPARPLALNFSSGKHCEAYYNLFKYSGIELADRGNFITFDEFRQGYSIFTVDLSPDVSAFDFIKSPSRNTDDSLRIEARFKEPLDSTVQVIVMGSMMSTIYIDKHRNVKTNFPN